MIKIEDEIRNRIKTLEISSPSFLREGFIPRKFTCDGENINPEIHVDKIPDGAKSLVIIMDDPDAPVTAWTHWLVWSVFPKSIINENYKQGITGKNDFGTRKYSGPCPPYGLHKYHFRIYALNDLPILKPDISRVELQESISSSVIAYGELIGKYKREK